HRVFAPSHDLEDVCQLMANDINQRHGVEQHCLEEAM
ncbi:methylaspartate mutase, partial [Salmonella enterica]|nr:methylaspartate mutase [Salmonella enterica]